MKLILATIVLGVFLLLQRVAAACSCLGTPSVCGSFCGGRSCVRLEGLKGVVRGYMYGYSGQYENCPKLEKLISARKDIETNKVRVELSRDHHNVELVFPFPYCVKAKNQPE